MLTLPRRFPTLKATTIGTAVFSIGFVGSVALLTYYHPGRSHGPTASVTSSHTGGLTTTTASSPPSTTTKTSGDNTSNGTSSPGQAAASPGKFVQTTTPSSQAQFQPQSTQPVQSSSGSGTTSAYQPAPPSTASPSYVSPTSTPQASNTGSSSPAPSSSSSSLPVVGNPLPLSPPKLPLP